MILSDEIRRRQEEAAAEAAAKTLEKVAKRMLKRGRSIQEVVEDTGVPEEKVRKLAEEL